jgi:AcrR family transcriptional regulator
LITAVDVLFFSRVDEHGELRIGTVPHELDTIELERNTAHVQIAHEAQPLSIREHEYPLRLKYELVLMSTPRIGKGSRMKSSGPQKTRRTAATRRRTPSQQRSTDMVRKVLEATAQVLGEVGLEATSTNKIAARAGIAVGSIYQYFPNKEAIFDGLVDDRIRRLEAMASNLMAALRTRSYPEAADAMLRATIDFYASEPELTPMLVSRTTPPLPNPQHKFFGHRLHDIARAYLLAYAHDLDVEDFDLAATISMHVVGHFAPWIALSVSDEQRRERFINEVVRMLSTWVGAKP